MSGAAVRHSLRKLVEPDEFEDAVSGIALRVEFQRRQVKPSWVEQFQTPSWAVDFGATGGGMQVGGTLRGGWASFCLPTGRGVATWNGREAPAGTISLLPPGAEVVGRTPDEFSWVTAAIPPECWERCLEMAGAPRPPGQLELGPCDPG